MQQSEPTRWKLWRKKDAYKLVTTPPISSPLNGVLDTNPKELFYLRVVGPVENDLIARDISVTSSREQGENE